MNLGQLKKELLKNPKYKRAYEKLDKDIAWQFGECITEFLLEHKLTWKKFAKKIGITEDLLGRLQGQDEKFAKGYLAKDHKIKKIIN